MPPRLLTLVIRLVVPARDRVETTGVLAELYVERERDQGRRRARWWYARQAVGYVVRVPLEALRRSILSMRGGAAAIGREQRAGAAVALVRVPGGRTGFFVDNVLTDVSFGLRQLARSPLFTLVSVISLALGMGVVIAAYTLYVSATSPLPFLDVDRLHRVYTSDLVANRGAYGATSFADAESIERSGVFDRVAADLHRRATLSTDEVTPRSESVRFVTDGYFETLGVAPLRGRWLTAERDDSEVVISHWAWERLFGSDPNALGRELRINGIWRTIVGIAPPWFQGYTRGSTTAVWLPVRIAPTVLRETGRRATLMSLSGSVRGRQSMSPSNVSRRWRQRSRPRTRSSGPASIWSLVDS